MTNPQAILIAASVLAGAVILSGTVSGQDQPPPPQPAEGSLVIAGPVEMGSPVWFSGPATPWPVLCRAKNLAVETPFVECFDFFGKLQVDAQGKITNR